MHSDQQFILNLWSMKHSYKKNAFWSTLHFDQQCILNFWSILHSDQQCILIDIAFRSTMQAYKSTLSICYSFLLILPVDFLGLLDDILMVSFDIQSVIVDFFIISGNTTEVFVHRRSTVSISVHRQLIVMIFKTRPFD